MTSSGVERPRCVYCQRGSAEGAKLSREHAFTDRAFDLLRVHGSDVHAASPRWAGLKPIEGVTLKDVCRDCNSALTGLDVAGIGLVREVKAKIAVTGRRRLEIDRARLGWLLKTHLNYIRFGPSVNFSQPDIDARFYQQLRVGALPQASLYRLFASQMTDSADLWNPNHPGSIQFISQGTFKIVDSEIAVGFLRFLWFVTYLIIPADAQYAQFQTRSDAAIAYLRAAGVVWQEVLATRVLKQRRIDMHATIAPGDLLIPAKVLVQIAH